MVRSICLVGGGNIFLVFFQDDTKNYFLPFLGSSQKLIQERILISVDLASTKELYCSSNSPVDLYTTNKLFS